MRFLHSTHTGHTALWVVFALFTLGLVGVFILSLRVERKARVFHWYVKPRLSIIFSPKHDYARGETEADRLNRLSGLVLTIAMVSYFAMATGLGIEWVPTKVHGHNPHNLHLFRQVYYASESTPCLSLTCPDPTLSPLFDIATRADLR